jgi:UDP-glucose 4-epimerase
MKILVSGGAGFIGSHIVRALLKSGHQVYALVREATDLYRLNGIRDKLQIVIADLYTDSLDLHLGKIKPDVVIHSAALYRRGNTKEDEKELLKVNIHGALSLYAASSALNVKYFINLCTGFVYSNLNRPASESDLPKPVNYYASSKLAAMHMMNTLYAQDKALPVLTLRIFSPYGPFDNRDKLVPYLIDSFLSDKSVKVTACDQIRDYIYVDDIADLVTHICSLESVIGLPDLFNVGLGKTHTLREFIELFYNTIDSSKKCVVYGAKEYRNQDRQLMFYAADIKQLEEYLGWVPRTCIEEGVERTVYYEKLFRKKGRCY